KGPATIKISAGKAEEAFRKFDHLAHEPSNIFTMRLRTHDILVIDNTAILHGRESFEDPDRELNRLLLDGKIPHADKTLQLGFSTD
ncbi:MAG: TauD/TfdA family dioxygenase, partial [Cyanobacteria bacterium J06597_16]